MIKLPLVFSLELIHLLNRLRSVLDSQTKLYGQAVGMNQFGLNLQVPKNGLSMYSSLGSGILDTHSIMLISLSILVMNTLQFLCQTLVNLNNS